MLLLLLSLLSIVIVTVIVTVTVIVIGIVIAALTTPPIRAHSFSPKAPRRSGGSVRKPSVETPRARSLGLRAECYGFFGFRA